MPTLGIYLMGAALLVVGGGLKVLRPAGTTRALVAAFPRPGPGVWAPAVRSAAAAEATLGAVALARPGPVPAAAVAVSYLGFAGWVLWARVRGGALSTCGCFGTPDTPPTLGHAVVDVVVAGGALGLLGSGPGGSIAVVLSRQYLDGAPLVAASLLAAGLAYVVMSPLARLLGAGTALATPALAAPPPAGRGGAA